MSRAFLVVMDSLGVGGAPDAECFFNDGRPDTGANTLLHIAQSRNISLPNLDRLGLGAAARLASGEDVPGFGARPQGLWGAASEISPGKDTPSGHWEIAGVPVPWDWRYFPDTQPAFPSELTAHVCKLAGTKCILGNKHSSGTVILDELGAEHLQTGWPICYTSADSVFQIAAHEEVFGLDRLLKLCADLAPILHAMRVGRVIARPFAGKPGSFTRTANRRDYAIAPPSDTILDIAATAGRDTHAIGKIGDIFSHRGIGQLHKGQSDADLAGHLLHQIDMAAPGSLTFANFVEFDSLYGHRRDIPGYAAQLEWFDTIAGQALSQLRSGDLIIFTADHGNDPSWTGTDHTRERIPVLGAGLGSREIGLVGFSDIGASIAAHLEIPLPGHGTSFI
ncbi:MAG: phosphopentomutase [Paracoccus sp. (in: a-proteobacteria)]